MSPCGILSCLLTVAFSVNNEFFFLGFTDFFILKNSDLFLKIQITWSVSKCKALSSSNALGPQTSAP